MSTDRPSPPIGLTRVDGFPFDVYASASLEVSTRTIAERCQRANALFVETFDFRPTFMLLVLSARDWPAHATFPVYGMPHFGKDRLIVAGEPNDMWRGFAGLLNRYVASKDELVAVYGPDINISPFSDLLAVHELAHILHSQAGVAFPRLWLMEVFCNLCLHAYVATQEPESLRILETMPPYMLGIQDSVIEYRKLQEFEDLYANMNPLNYGWYQCHFHTAAKRTYDTGGTPALQRYWRTFAQPRTRPADAELVELLKQNDLAEVAAVVEKF